MALFYLVAKKESDLDWRKVHKQIIDLEHKYITVFPIPYELNLSINGIGITVSGKFKNEIREVKNELTFLLDFLWKNEFVVCDLYKGDKVASETFLKVINYL